MHDASQRRSPGPSRVTNPRGAPLVGLRRVSWILNTGLRLGRLLPILCTAQQNPNTWKITLAGRTRATSLAGRPSVKMTRAPKTLIPIGMRFFADSKAKTRSCGPALRPLPRLSSSVVPACPCEEPSNAHGSCYTP